MSVDGARADDLTGQLQAKRWMILILVGFAQLMVTLDVTIVNVALPSAQNALHFSADNRQWVLTAYALSFGSLLLLGGKLGDLFGRKWTFVAGLVGFAVASALGGLAQSFAVLVGARALQGAFGALLAPSALSLLTLTFRESRDRQKAFGIFTAIAGSGASLGLLLGGALTQALSWRWSLYVNLVVAVPAAIAALRLVPDMRSPRRPKIDVAGVLTVTGGLFALVYGFANAETHSWSASATIIAIASSAVLLLAFVAIEARVREPLLPLDIVRDRARGGAYAAMALAGAGVFSLFLFLSFFLQNDLRLTPLLTGVSFLPFTGSVIFAATVNQTRVLPRIGARPVVFAGSALGAAGMLLLTGLSPHSTYPADVLPSLILAGLGLGSVFSSALSTGTLGVRPADAGIASAIVNMSQQIGGSVGTAILSTVFAGALTGYLSSHPAAPGVQAAATVHGDTIAFYWSAGFFAVGLLVALFLLPGRNHTRSLVVEAERRSPTLEPGPPAIASAAETSPVRSRRAPPARAERLSANPLAAVTEMHQQPRHCVDETVRAADKGRCRAVRPAD
jgi:EmrB/QacA subfamily drug resistance transporter